MTPLEDLLQQCTVKITIPSGWGTGFFVAPGLILTCAHVVRKADDLQVTVSYPVWQQPLSAIVKAKADDGKTLDLALVEISEPLPDHPCVLLDEEPVAVGQALYSYGYLESYTNAAPVRPVNEGLTGDTPPLLKLQGAQIEKGISGAALLNLKSGKVCGMVKETRAAGFDLGGGAIPTRVILEQFPELRSLQQSFHGGVSATCPSDNRRWVNLITPPGIDFQPYREAVIDKYSQQCHLYTPTDALLPLEVRSVERQAQDKGQKQQPEKMGEPFPVLEGLRKYALETKREHVLLAGRPGSGKSTTLRQLAVSLAQEGQVPVLVQLKGDLPVPDLIQAEFRRMRQRVTSEEIDKWLFDDSLVLLLDGVNEIPNDDLRLKLAQFRGDNLTVPMIFTTRALLGNDLGIDKRLEMHPLSLKQMREFVGKYLPEQGNRLLEQLSDRLRELAETPLLLKLLCDVFDPKTNQIPQNRGELFQWFDRDYRRIKKEIEYVPVSENFWEFKSEILQYLAFSMIQGEIQPADLQKPPEPWLTIPKSRAEEILETWLHQRGILDAPTKAKKWLQDLCNYHLLQNAAKIEEIEFHHQLFQEYYAAEYLLKVLPTLTDDQLKRDYLNYLKWTEPLALMLALVEEEAQALRVVRLALDVDLMLGARLAGEVKWEFQADTVTNVVRQKVPEWLKIFLLGETRSPKAVDELIKTMKQHSDPTTRGQVVWASRRLSGKFMMPLISEAIKDNDPHIRKVALRTIAESDTEQAVELVAQILLKEPVTSVRETAVISVLGKSTSEASILALLSATQDAELNVYGMADHILKEMDRATLLPVLAKILKNKDIEPAIRQSAAHQLGDLGDESTLMDLFEAQLDLNLNIQEEAADAWVRIRSKLIRKDTDVQNDEEKERENQINHWRKYLKSEEPIPRGNAVLHLAQLLDKESAVHLVNQALDDPNHYVRGHAITSLIKLIGREALSETIRALDDSHHEVRNQASQALLSIKDPPLRDIEIPSKTIDNLVDTLNQSQEPYELIKVTKILVNLCHIDPGQLLHANLENAFIDVSHNVDDRLRYIATQGLGMFSSQRSGDRLLKILEEDNDDMVILGAVESLKKMPCEITKIYLSKLALLISTLEKSLITDALLSIQNRCQFYNYEIWKAHLTTQKADRQTHPNSDPNAITIKTLESLTIMTDKAPIFNQQHATIGVNYAAEGSKVEFTKHTSSSEQTFEILLTDYQQFIQQLQQKYPTLADTTTIPQIIEVEAKLIETQDRQRWQNFLTLKQLWNGGKKATFKLGEHFTEDNLWGKMAIAFLEGVSEDGK